jgi:predicted nucleotidyltransferase
LPPQSPLYAANNGRGDIQGPYTNQSKNTGTKYPAKIALSSATELADIYEVGEGLENRIIKAAGQSGNLDELKYKIKTKRFSLSRINRILLYCLWDLRKNQIARYDECGPQYLHILGFSPSGQKILQEIKSLSFLPIFHAAAK